MSDIYKFLEDHNIEYERHDHAPVYTVDDVNRLVPPPPRLLDNTQDLTFVSAPATSSTSPEKLSCSGINMLSKPVYFL